MADPGMQKLLKKAREMKEKQDRKLAKAVVKSSVVHGKITGKMNAHRVLLSLDVDPELIRPENRELVEEKITEVVNRLADKIDHVLVDRFGLVNQMPMPDIDDLFDGRY